MSCLDDKTYAALLDGTLDESTRARVLAHLEESCAACEDFLAAREEVDPMDGLVDEALLGLAPVERAEAFDEVGFARVQRGMRRRGPWVAGLAALVASAAVVLFSVTSEEPGGRLKGTAAEPAPRLEVMRRSAQGFDPLPEGGTVQVGDALVFMVELQRAGCVNLARDGTRLLEAPICLQAGRHVLEEGGRVVAWPARAPGAVRFEVRGESSSSASFEVRVIEGR